ncbi:hypothetical protein IAG44_04650 [Streptomyces roseirectus]|uniref:Uncharacterized protein n=1 Tax=Streptomyces roseirectus TaxID=2768066 RepID=A0A7H0I7Q3_9ACTN|nr:hypothetical protein [Streptomyces roseirectus]QNP68819.1 hypothetical protein IAG44_04650 [Streptomyces roseirectus]
MWWSTSRPASTPGRSNWPGVRRSCAYSALARYTRGRTVVGYCGFTGLYQNTLQLLGRRQVIHVERPFSMPLELEIEVSVRDEGGVRVVRVAPADSMWIFLGQVLGAVPTGSREFDEPLLADGWILGRLLRDRGEAWSGVS